MPKIGIGGTGNIDHIQMDEQASTPSTPGAGKSAVYLKSDGLYVIDDAGAVTGPLVSAVGGGATHFILDDTTLGSPGNFDVSSISSSYQHLLLILTARSSVSGAGDSAYMFFNNDTTTTNYFHQRHYAANGAVTNSEVATPVPGFIPGDTAPADSFGTIQIFIPHYTSTSFLKLAICDFVYHPAAGEIGIGKIGFGWEDGGATAINRITIQPDGYATDNFATGSRLQIIGLNFV